MRALAAWPVLALLLAGCGYCDAQSIDMDVTLTLVDEEVRTVPIIASGALSAAGIDVPDSHGRFEWSVKFSDTRPDAATVTGLQLDLRVGGRTVPVVITDAQGFGNWDRAGDSYRGSIEHGSRLVVWWTVDRDAVDSPTELLLASGAAYHLDVSFNWRLDGCEYSGQGTTSTAIDDNVQSAVVSKSFRTKAGPTISSTGQLAGFSVDVEIMNGVATQIDDATAVLLWLPTGVAAPGISVWDPATVQVNGLPLDDAAPGDTVTISGASKPLASNGAGIWILVVWLDHDPQGSTGLQHDLMGWGKQG